MVTNNYILTDRDLFDCLADFFDKGVVPSTSVNDGDESEKTAPAAMAEKLPEGFFDDPKMDAKVSVKISY